MEIKLTKKWNDWLKEKLKESPLQHTDLLLIGMLIEELYCKNKIKFK